MRSYIDRKGWVVEIEALHKWMLFGLLYLIVYSHMLVFAELLSHGQPQTLFDVD